MPRPLQLNDTAPFAVRDGARQIGQRLTIARKRRRLTQRDLAGKAGIAYATLRAVEAGNLQTGFGAYLAVMWALGLEADFYRLADPQQDVEGQQLELSRLPQRVRSKQERYDDYF